MAAVELEVCLHSHCSVSFNEITNRFRQLILTHDAPIAAFAAHDAVLRANVRFLRIVHAATASIVTSTSSINDENPHGADASVALAPDVNIFVFQLARDAPLQQMNDGGAADDSGDDSSSMPSFTVHSLPHEQFDPLWDSLSFSDPIKQLLLGYVLTSMLFARRGVSSHIIVSNRLLLLHGPPGTGKTSLCNALAHKLALRGYYEQTLLIEINAHSLFSKWFSESGKLVTQLFARIRQLTSDPNCLVCVLIDEVESLAAARSAALNGVEPSDSLRVVNALLTQLDRLKTYPNVLLMATSNITAAIDVAFLDRADLKLFVGPPDLAARYTILESCIDELQRADVLVPRIDCLPFALISRISNHHQQSAEAPPSSDAVHISVQLLAAAVEAHGASGRMLRKLPLLAVSRMVASGVARDQFDSREFVAVLLNTIKDVKEQ